MIAASLLESARRIAASSGRIPVPQSVDHRVMDRLACRLAWLGVLSFILLAPGPLLGQAAPTKPAASSNTKGKSKSGAAMNGNAATPGNRAPGTGGAGTGATGTDRPEADPTTNTKVASKKGAEKSGENRGDGTRTADARAASQGGQPRTGETRTGETRSGAGRDARSGTPRGKETAGAIRPPIGPVAGAPMEPEWHRDLTDEHRKYVDEILGFWESQTKSVKRYRCEFTRYDFDAEFGPRGREPTASTISKGSIMYAAPDKGLYRITKIQHYKPGEKGEATYEELKGEVGDHWVCDGKSVFTFVASRKKVVKTALPPELQGEGIIDGPLPFFMGANAKRMKDRYWIHVITPPEATKRNEYWLEAYPKRQEEAADHKFVHVIIDEKFLPKALKLFPPEYGGSSGSSRYSTLVFDEREVNWSILKEQLLPFMREFYEPKVPRGWEMEVAEYASPDAGSTRVDPPPRQADKKTDKKPVGKK